MRALPTRGLGGWGSLPLLKLCGQGEGGLCYCSRDCVRGRWVRPPSAVCCRLSGGALRPALHPAIYPPATWGGGFHALGRGTLSRHVAGDQLECGSLLSSGEQDLGFSSLSWVWGLGGAGRGRAVLGEEWSPRPAAGAPASPTPHAQCTGTACPRGCLLSAGAVLWAAESWGGVCVCVYRRCHERV